MTQKQFVAYGIIASLALTVIAGVLEPASEDSLYTLSGLGFFAFGIWSSILLLKNK